MFGALVPGVLRMWWGFFSDCKALLRLDYHLTGGNPVLSSGARAGDL